MQSRTVANDLLLGEMSVFLREGRDVKMVPKGVSMLPFIRGGEDRVLLRRKDDYRIGDIVLAELSEGRYVLHRIIAIDGDKVTLMGDGNLVGCEYCRMSDIEAFVAKIYKKSREIDCMSASHLRAARVWKSLLPVRRYLLAIYRRLIK